MDERVDVEAGLVRLAAARGWFDPALFPGGDGGFPALRLVERGALTHAQVASLLGDATDRNAADPGHAPRRAAWRAAALALRQGWASFDAVNRALAELGRREREGLPWASLDEVLLEQKVLSQTAAVEARRRLAGAGPDLDSLQATVQVDSLQVAATVTPARPAIAPLPEPVSFRNYEVVEELGRGGVGVVYKAWHPGLKTHLAVKVLLSGGDASPEAIERFRTEARVLARLRHPGIVAVHDVWDESGRTFLAMEFVEGEGLDRLIPRGPSGGLPAREALRMLAEIAEAIHHAHEAGVVHRDLKPENVIRDGAGRLKVMDFGLAKVLDVQETRLTRTGVVAGTPAYMAPEQVNQGVQVADARTDVYQLGAILYELLTGRAPYDGATVTEILLQVADQEPPRPRRLRPQIDRDAETICLKAMEREPGRRYASARALADDCRRWLDGEPIRARRTSPAERLVRWARRRKALAGLAAAALALLLVSAGAGWHARSLGQQRARLLAEVVEGLRAAAQTNLRATLLLRRHGAPMREARDEFLAPLEAAARRALHHAPGWAEPHYHLGRFYRALLRFDEALAEQDQALARDPDYAPSRYEHAVLLARRYGDRMAALRARWARAALARSLPGPRPPDDALRAADPEATRVHEELARDLDRLARGAGGLPAQGEAGLGAARLSCARGLVRLAAGGPRAAGDACALLEQALAEDPALEEAYEGLALAELARDGLAAAIAVYDRGIAVDAGYLPFWLGRGQARNQEALLRQRRGMRGCLAGLPSSTAACGGAIAAATRRGRSRRPKPISPRPWRSPRASRRPGRNGPRRGCTWLRCAGIAAWIRKRDSPPRKRTLRVRSGWTPPPDRFSVGRCCGPTGARPRPSSDATHRPAGARRARTTTRRWRAGRAASTSCSAAPRSRPGARRGRSGGGRTRSRTGARPRRTSAGRWRATRATWKRGCGAARCE